MTALCGGGSSGPRAGFGIAVQVGTAQIAALLNNVPTPVAVALAGVIGVVNYELSTFCLSDPPPMPTITAQDYVDALNFTDVLKQVAAVKKFEDLLGNLLWPTFCECTSAPTPAPPALPSAPTGLPTVQPPQVPSGGITQPCWDRTIQFGPVAAGAIVNLSGDILPATQTTSVHPAFTGGPATAFVMPTGTTTITEVTTFDENGAGGSVSITLYMFNTAGNTVENLGPFDGTPAAGVPVSNNQLQPTTAFSWQMVIDNGDSVAHSGSLNLKFFCSGGSPNQVLTPCCPPDPSLTNMLQTVLSYVQSIYLSIPTPVTSYAESTVHAVTGNGSFLIGTSTIAVKVELTAIGSGVGFVPGDPVAYINAGWITPIAAEAPLAGYPIRYSPQVLNLPDIAEQVGYTLPPGSAATITELTAGP